MIRTATPAEVPALAALARAAYGVYVPRLGFEPPAMHPDLAGAVARGRVRVVGRPAEGYVIAYAADGAWHVENLAVAPAAQGRGLARALLARAEAEGRAAGHARVTLYTNAAMAGPLALYPRLGYARTHAEARGRLHLIHFAKEIA